MSAYLIKSRRYVEPPSALEAVKASKRKCKHQRDNWKARALIYLAALKEIRSTRASQDTMSASVAATHRLIAYAAILEANRIGGT